MKKEQAVPIDLDGEDLELIMNALSLAGANLQMYHDGESPELLKQCDLAFEAFHRAMHKKDARGRFNTLQIRFTQIVLDFFSTNADVKVINHPDFGTATLLDHSKPVS